MATKITVGKIVATATEAGWSQAYHAGGFTAVVSVTEDGSEEIDNKTVSLQAHGKKLLDTLVSEYFTLVTKDLDTVKNAVVATVDKVPRHIHVSLVVAAVVKNVLYVVVANEGRVLLKRGEKLGLLLEGKPGEEKIASVSGFLENGDIVLLSTPGFNTIFPHDELAEALQGKSVEELAEFFAPKVHASQNGAASGLVFSYHEDEPSAIETPVVMPRPKEEEVEVKQDVREDNFSRQESIHQDTKLPGFEKALPSESAKVSFSHRQRLFLTITVILGLVLIGSIFVFQLRQQQAKQQALFQSLYTPAKAKFDEAQGLLDLNKSLAVEDLTASQQELTDAKAKFPADSTEEKQITALLSQVTTVLTDAKKIPLLTASPAATNASPLLAFAAKHDGTYVAQDGSNFYTADPNGITSYTQTASTGKKLITNSGDWTTIGGFQTYLGNFYVLDQTKSIIKYVSGGGSYAKSSYFASGVTPNLSKAISIAIDGSIWIVSSDGTITKYTKGTQDSFAVTGLTQPLSNPTQLVTTVDFDNIYILDKGNERVVVLKKDGTFVAQYASDTVQTATLMDISEKDKKIYLLSNGTVYQLDLK